MPLLKTIKNGAFEEVHRNIRFMKAVQQYSAWTKTYYVDNDDGADGDTGESENDAYLNVQTAINAAGAWGKVYIKPKKVPELGAEGAGPYLGGANSYILPATAANFYIPYTFYGMHLIGCGVSAGAKRANGRPISAVTAASPRNLRSMSRLRRSRSKIWPSMPEPARSARSAPSSTTARHGSRMDALSTRISSGSRAAPVPSFLMRLGQITSKNARSSAARSGSTSEARTASPSESISGTPSSRGSLPRSSATSTDRAESSIS